MKRYRYDMNHNAFAGLPDPQHPQIEIRKVFPKATNFDPVTIGDCWIFEAEEEVTPLPPQFTELPHPALVFIRELDALCAKHGVELHHQDGHGCAYLQTPANGRAGSCQIAFEHEIRGPR